MNGRRMFLSALVIVVLMGLWSVSEDIYTMGAPQMPRFLGGQSKDVVWWITRENLGSSLLVYQSAPTAQNPKHGVISPKQCMKLETFRVLVENTRHLWRKQGFVSRRSLT